MSYNTLTTLTPNVTIANYGDPIKFTILVKRHPNDFSYIFSEGLGSINNNLFTIVNNQLRVNSIAINNGFYHIQMKLFYNGDLISGYTIFTINVGTDANGQLYRDPDLLYSNMGTLGMNVTSSTQKQQSFPTSYPTIMLSLPKTKNISWISLVLETVNYPMAPARNTSIQIYNSTLTNILYTSDTVSVTSKNAYKFQFTNTSLDPGSYYIRVNNEYVAWYIDNESISIDNFTGTTAVSYIYDNGTLNIEPNKYTFSIAGTELGYIILDNKIISTGSANTLVGNLLNDSYFPTQGNVTLSNEITGIPLIDGIELVITNNKVEYTTTLLPGNYTIRSTYNGFNELGTSFGNTQVSVNFIDTNIAISTTATEITYGDSVKITGIVTKPDSIVNDTFITNTSVLLSFKIDPIATSVGRYALFAGKNRTIGTYQETNNIVDIWDSITMSWFTIQLSEKKINRIATSVGQYVLFAGGALNDSGSNDGMPTTVVDIWDSQTFDFLENPGNLSVARLNIAATSVGKYALFAGGSTMNATSINTVDIWDSQTKIWSNFVLPNRRDLITAVSVGQYALFAGGQIDSGMITDVVDIWDSKTLNWLTSTNLSEARLYLAATPVNGYVIFAGGQTDSGMITNVVDIWDSRTQNWLENPTNLSMALYDMCATTIDKYALFAGGLDDFGETNTIYIWDSELKEWIFSSISMYSPSSKPAATSVNGYALIIPNNPYSGHDTMNIYNINRTITNPITNGNIEFYANNDLIGNVDFTDSIANITVSNLAVFSKTLTAKYTGNAIYSNADSNSIDITINQKPIIGTINIANKVYDGNTNVTITSNTIIGNINGDIVYPNITNSIFIDKNVSAIGIRTIDNLIINIPVKYSRSTSVGKYLLALNTYYNGNYTIDFWDSNRKKIMFTHDIPSIYNDSCVCTSVGIYGLFVFINNVFIFNSITKVSYIEYKPSFTSIHRVAVNCGKYAIFAGGFSNGIVTNVVDIWDSETQTWIENPPTLQYPVYYLAATSLGKYVLFVGGRNITAQNYVQILNIDTMQWVSHSFTLSQAKYEFSGTTVGNYAIFAGGLNNFDNTVDTVDIFLLNNDTISKISNPGILSSSKTYISATSCSIYALFGGTNGGNTNQVIDIWNSYTQQWLPPLLLSIPFSSLHSSATSIENNAFFVLDTGYINIFSFGTTVVPTLGSPALLGSASSNYSLTIGNTFAEITPKPITSSFTVGSKIYNGSTNLIANSVVTSNVITNNIDGDNVNLVITSPTFVGNGNIGTNKPVIGNYQLTGDAKTNYTTINATILGTGNITPLAITGSFTVNNKPYDGTTDATIATKSLQNHISGDDVILNIYANFDSKNVANNINVFPTKIGSGLNGSHSNNYTLGIVPNTSADIIPKNLYGDFTVADKEYDTNNSATVTGTSVSGNILGENITYAITSATFNNKKPGSGIIVTSFGNSFSPTNLLSNYNLIYNTTTANITNNIPFKIDNTNLTIFLYDDIEANIELSDSILLESSLVGKIKVGSGKTFDGKDKNFNLLNISSYEGAIEMLGGTVKNLIVKVYNCPSLKDGTGFAVYSNSSAKSEGIIDNIKVITGNAVMGNNCGGFVGTNAGNLTIQNSYFYGSISGNNSGGIIGNNNGGQGITLVIDNCKVFGNLANESGAIIGNNNTVTVKDTYYAGKANNQNEFEVKGATNNATKTNVKYYEE
jgi:hypothetical protein